MSYTVSAQRHELASALRELAKTYFDGKELGTNCGICSSLSDEGLSCAYSRMGDLMEEMGETSNRYGPYSEERSKWAPRAWMCLFLAEYIEETLRAADLHTLEETK